MNKKLPFEEALGQQLNELPLPNEDASWQKMQELLDKKDRRRFLFFLRTNRGKGILTLLLLLGFLVIMHSRRRESGTAPAPAAAPFAKQERGAAANTIAPVARKPNRAALHPERTFETPERSTSGSVKTNSSLTPITSLASPGVHPSAGKTLVNKYNRPGAGRTKNGFVRRSVPVPVQRNPFTQQASLPAYRQAGRMDREQLGQQVGGLLTASFDAMPLSNHAGVAGGSSLYPMPEKGISLPLAVSGKYAGENKMDGKELSGRPHRSFFVRAGVGVQQQIPLGGQKHVAFSLHGNKNPLADYIPSLFVRWEKDKQWYVQAEFNYASPKLVKDFSYSRRTYSDSASRTVTTELLKKVFYRELPVSFNYYLRPNWSAGAGATYSWFRGAITEKQIATRNLQTQASAVDKQIVPIEHYTDSFLYRSHSYLMLQTNYEGKNFSLGLRFSKDVQPYIKYTLPDGMVADKKNWSLELLFRLGLWKSAKF